LAAVYEAATAAADKPPEELQLTPGQPTTLRGELGRVLQYFNRASQGAILSASADLLGSTSVSKASEGFAEGYFNSVDNPRSRTLSIGGICEDAISGILSGISTCGYHMGVGSSYAAFIAALGHVSARLHAIGNQARQMAFQDPYRTFMLICAHAGLKTGEDGPTHADPQALQLLQENFPRGTAITLTPWDPQEIWTLVTTALAKRPALIAPFVTRPTEIVIDRAALGLAPVGAASAGLYALRKAQARAEGTLVLQGSEVAYAFIQETLPLLTQEGIDLEVYYVASAELFDLLPADEQERIFSESQAQRAMGITGFTFPTMYRWIRSDYGRRMSLHPYLKGHYLGSGQAEMVLAEAGLDGQSQFDAIRKYLKGLQ
jgi:transketolase